MRKLIVLLVCIAALVGCATGQLSHQVATHPPEVEKNYIYDESETYEADESLPYIYDEPELDTNETTYENGEEEEIIPDLPYIQAPQQPSDIDRGRQATPVCSGTFHSKLESLLSLSEYGGIFWSFQDNGYDIYLNIWVVDSTAVTAAVQAAFDYFEGRELTRFETRLLEANASLEELETLREHIRSIELVRGGHEFITPILEEEQNRLLVHGAVLDESRIRSEVDLLLRAGGFPAEIIVFDLHSASEEVPIVPPLTG